VNVTASRWTTGNPAGAEKARYRNCSDRTLLDAVRALELGAIEEFIERFQHVALVQARRLRIPREERKGWVIELLYDVCAALARERRAAPPRSLVAYLITACKRKAFAALRDRALREVRERDAADDVAGTGERAVVTCASEYSLRAMYGPASEASELPPVLERLVSMFDEGVSEDERQLLSWLGQRIPYSTIAGWLGMQRSAVIKRVTRLRARLIDAALRYGEGLEPDERHELLRFLRRTGAYSERDLGSLIRLGDVRHPSPERQEYRYSVTKDATHEQE
jgi:hypothetical protein